MPKTLNPDELAGLQVVVDDYNKLLADLRDHPGKSIYEGNVRKLSAVKRQLAQQYEALLFAQEQALNTLANAAVRNLPALLETIKGLIHDQITITLTPERYIVVTSAKGDYDTERAVLSAFQSHLSTIITLNTGKAVDWGEMRLIPDHDEPLPFPPLDESENV